MARASSTCSQSDSTSLRPLLAMMGQGMDGTTDYRGGLMRGMYGMVVAGLMLREGISMARMMMIRASLSLLLGHDTCGHALMVRD